MKIHGAEVSKTKKATVSDIHKLFSWANRGK